jgi:hypothetical protein
VMNDEAAAESVETIREFRAGLDDGGHDRK